MKKELSDMYFLGRKCIICNRYGLYKLKNRRRVKCKHCKKYYSLKRLRRDLDILYYFYLEVSARKTAKEMELDYGVVHRRFMEFRKLITNYCNEQAIRLNGKIELDETYFGGKRKGKRGRGSKNKAIAFGILERKGKVYTVIIENVSAETLMREIQNKTRKGSVFYTDGFKSYASLRQYGKHDTIDYDYSYVKGKTHINGIEGFWSYSKERFHKYHGINKKNYPLYLKEMEFRFNNRKENVLKLLVDICIRRRRISAKLH